MGKYDGGAAFPVFDSVKHGDYYVNTATGMTLRDWFAGQALTGRSFGNTSFDYQKVAERCYAIADAMIAEMDKE
jgi:hypothetical protein